MDTSQSSSTRTPACSLPSTVPFGRYCFLQLPFGLGLFPRHLPEKDGSDPWRMPRMYQNHRWHHCTWLHWCRTWCPPTRSHANCTCKYNLVFNPQKTHVKAQAVNFFGCLYDANILHPDPGKVDAVHAITSTHQHVTELQEFLGLVTYLSPFISWSIHLDCPSTRAAQEGHRLQLELYLWHCF